MKKNIYVFWLFILLVVGCHPTTNYTTSTLETHADPPNATETYSSPTIEINPTIKSSPATSFGIVIDKISPDNNSNIKLNNQCLKVADETSISNSIIVLRSLKDVQPRQASDIILIDMSKETPEKTTQKVEITPNFAVSSNGELIAYLASTISNEEVSSLDLVIANGDLQTQNSFSWYVEWGSILGWSADQRIIISSSKVGAKLPYSTSYILVDPRNGDQQIVNLSISDFMDASTYDVPFWENWYGVLIDPTFMWGIYPKQSDISAEMYTYALWDITNNKPIVSLEKVSNSPWNFIKASPMPDWSRDGKQFAFTSQIQDSPGRYELFSVNTNGDIAQLTNLSNVGYIWPSFHSWSPNNSKIAFYVSRLRTGGANKANAVLINTNTLDVIDLCLSSAFQTNPIWSPDGKQFLVTDIDAEGHQRILLIDIENHSVFPLIEDAEIIGWMVKP